jgi:tetratricopeptide (TPR) repeat protein
MTETMHPTDEALQAYGDDPASVPAETGAHVVACTRCRDVVDFYRHLGRWRDAATEPDDGDSDQLLSALAFRRRTIAEDEEAARLLDDIIDDPYEFVLARVAARQRYRTGGVVRKLCAATREWRKKNIKYASVLISAAVQIAEALPDDIYPANAVNGLRGMTYMLFGDICSFTGEYDDGYKALDKAEAAFCDSPDERPGLGLTKTVRAILLRYQNRNTEALAQISSAAAEFEGCRDIVRYLEAKEIEAWILYAMGRVDAAKTLSARNYDVANAVGDLELMARSARNLAYLSHEAGDLAVASAHALVALRAYEELGHDVLVLRAKWLISRIALTAGRFADAARQLAELAVAFENVGNTDDAADLRLDLAEALLMLKRYDDVGAICTELVIYYNQRCVFPSAAAAAAFLQECNNAHRLDPSHIKYVREYLTKIKTRPTLEFTPPPF